MKVYFLYFYVFLFSTVAFSAQYEMDMLDYFKYTCLSSMKILLATFFIFLITACGNKGPLTLPDNNQDNAGIEQSSDDASEY